MKLLLDIGNSSVNWAWQQQDEFTASGAFSYKKNNLQQDLEENLSFINSLTDVLVSNVAGVDVFNLLNDWVKEQWQLQCWQARVSAEYKELKNSYSETEQMGIDRWLVMIASWEKYKSALCIVGCGTALTIDLVDSEGKHLGGYIVPGIELMQRALVSSTDQINITVKHQASLAYAKDTQSAVNNGAFLAAVSMVDRVADKFSIESKSKPKYIISGGMAELLKPLLAYSFEHKPNLVLTGLSMLHKANK